ncbi:hypothetical protein ElyMa_006889700 [Elysia marginata]|uniref:Uncharacterized protein n=1 Tax=Elysia marginata TaxID=1093978 RepID=A0AAV4JEF2_9GAST|nr:hypothetical protein ElyMa_006889700 [Elysia marginata]
MKTVAAHIDKAALPRAAARSGPVALFRIQSNDDEDDGYYDYNDHDDDENDGDDGDNDDGDDGDGDDNDGYEGNDDDNGYYDYNDHDDDGDANDDGHDGYFDYNDPDDDGDDDNDGDYDDEDDDDDDDNNDQTHPHAHDSKSAKSSNSSKRQVHSQVSNQNGHLPKSCGKSHQSRAMNRAQESQDKRSRGEKDSMSSSNRRDITMEEEEQGMASSFAVEDATITDPSSFQQFLRSGRAETNSDERYRTKTNSNTNGDVDQHISNPRLNIHGRSSVSPSHGHRPQRPPENMCMDELEAGDGGSPIIPVQNADYSVMDEVEEEDDDDEVPATPPSKKVRFDVNITHIENAKAVNNLDFILGK